VCAAQGSGRFDVGRVVEGAARTCKTRTKTGWTGAHEGIAWTHPGIGTYYRNSRGRVVVNNPFRVIDFWGATRRADLGEYVTETIRNGSPSPRGADAAAQRSTGPRHRTRSQAGEATPPVDSRPQP
jgi:hypothetical protein